MAKATATLDLNAAAFQRGLKSATAALGQLGSTIASIGTGAALGGLAAAAAGVAVSMAGMEKALDLGGELSDMSARTGIAVSQLVVLRQAFANAGLSSEDVGTAVARMQKALAGVNEDGDETTSVFQKLGLDMDKLRGMAPDEQFQAVGRALASIQDPATRTATAMQIFGRSGANLLSVFRDVSAISNARAEVGGLADVMDKNAGLFDTISDRINTAFNLKPMQLFAAMAAELAPKIEAISKTIAEMDFSGIGKGIAADLQAAFEGETLAGGIANLGSKIVTVLGQSFVSLADIAGGVLLKAFEEPLTYLQAKIEELTERIAYMFSDQGAIDLQVKINNKLADAAKAAGLTDLAKQYNDESDKLIEGATINPDDVSMDERMRRIRESGGPKFGLGEGRTSEQMIQDGLDRVKAKVAEQFPQTAAAIQGEIAKATDSNVLSPGPLRPSKSIIDGKAGPKIYNRQGVEGVTPFFNSPFAPGAGLGGLAGAFQKQLADLLGGNAKGFQFDQNEGRKRTQIIQSELQKQTALLKASLATPRVIQVQPVLA